VDEYGLFTAIFGSTAHLNSTLKVGNIDIYVSECDPGPPYSFPITGFINDCFHPNTIIHGMIANCLLQALDSGYGVGLAVFSEQEMLSFAGIPYGGADTLQAQIGPYSNYVILPANVGPPVASVATNAVTTCGTDCIGLGGSVGGCATGGVWTTTGVGTFSPDATTVNASYCPAPADLGQLVTNTL
jgi:hypothetical protein